MLRAAGRCTALAAVCLLAGIAPAVAHADTPPLQVNSGFEPGDTTPVKDVGTINLVSSPVNSGAQAMQAAQNAYRGFTVSTQIGQPTAYRMYAHWTGLPSSGSAQIAWGRSEAAAATSFTVRVDATGRLSLRDAGGAVRAQSAPLAAGAWHLIEFIVAQNGDGTGTGSLRVDGTDIATNVAGNFGAAALDRLRVGQIGTTPLPGITHDDVAVGLAGGPWIGPVPPSEPPPPPPPPPDNQLQYGFEPADTAVFTNVGTIDVVADPVHSGTAAMRPGTNSYRSFHTSTTIGQPTAYRLYGYWTAPPSSGAAQLAWILADLPGTSGTRCCTIRVDVQGRVSLNDANGSVRGRTGPLATGAWHLIEFVITQQADGTGVGSLRVDGTTVAANATGKYGAYAADRFRLGQIGPTVLPGVTEDDIAMTQPGGTWIGPVAG